MAEIAPQPPAASNGVFGLVSAGVRLGTQTARALGSGAAHMVGSGAHAVGAAAETVSVQGLRPIIRAVLEALATEVDLTAFVRENVDINELARDVDVNAIAAKVDVDAIAARMDLDAIVESVDLDRQVARVDIGAVVDRVDVNAIAATVDVDAIAATVDVDAIAAKVNVQAIIDRMDLVGLTRMVMEAIDLPQIIRESTGSLSTEAVRGVRAQTMNADDAISVVVGRLLHRQRPTRLNGHPVSDADRPGHESGQSAHEHR